MLQEVMRTNRELEQLKKEASEMSSELVRVQWRLKSVGKAWAEIDETKGAINEMKVELGQCKLETSELLEMARGLTEGQESAWKELELLRALVEEGGRDEPGVSDGDGEQAMVGKIMIQGVVGLLEERAQRGDGPLLLADLEDEFIERWRVPFAGHDKGAGGICRFLKMWPVKVVVVGDGRERAVQLPG